VLPLFVVTVVLLALAVRERLGARAALVAAILASTIPAWSVWSLKARVGYPTGHLALACTMLLVARTANRPVSVATSAGVGAVAAVGFLGHATFGLVAAPILLWHALQRDTWSRLGGLALGGGIVLGGYALAASMSENPYWRPPLLAYSDPIGALIALPRRAFVLLSGSFFWNRKLDAGPITILAGGAWGAAGLAAAFAVTRWSRRPWVQLEAACLAGIGLVLAFVTIIGLFSYRYMLSLTFPIIYLLAGSLERWLGHSNRARRALAGGTIAVLALLGVGAHLEARRFAYTQQDLDAANRSTTARRDLAILVDTLERAGVRHVYSADALLQWNLMFASRERIIARWTAPKDRVPRYPLAVDSARLSGVPIALVGYSAQAAKVTAAMREVGEHHELWRIAKGYWIVFAPTAALLQRLGFEPALESPSPELW
jgi:hypothetical protein